MKLLAPTLLAALLCLLDDVYAVRLAARGRLGGFGRADAAANAGPGAIVRRASMVGTPDLANEGNLQYETNITLGGRQFQVLIDTGRCVCVCTRVGVESRLTMYVCALCVAART